MTSYRITVRYGSRYQRYHTFGLEARDVAEALRLSSERIPETVLPEADLVEIRLAVDPDERGFMEEP